MTPVPLNSVKGAAMMACSTGYSVRWQPYMLSGMMGATFIPAARCDVGGAAPVSADVVALCWCPESAASPLFSLFTTALSSEISGLGGNADGLSCFVQLEDLSICRGGTISLDAGHRGLISAERLRVMKTRDRPGGTGCFVIHNIMGPRIQLFQVPPNWIVLSPEYGLQR